MPAEAHMTEAVRWGAITQGDFLVLRRPRIALRSEFLSPNQEEAVLSRMGDRAAVPLQPLPNPSIPLPPAPAGPCSAAPTTCERAMTQVNTYRAGPDDRGHFGLYGGRFVA